MRAVRISASRAGKSRTAPVGTRTAPCDTYIHTFFSINPRSRMTIQDAKTVSDEIEKGAKKN